MLFIGGWTLAIRLGIQVASKKNWSIVVLKSDYRRNESSIYLIQWRHQHGLLKGLCKTYVLYQFLPLFVFFGSEEGLMLPLMLLPNGRSLVILQALFLLLFAPILSSMFWKGTVLCSFYVVSIKSFFEAKKKSFNNFLYISKNKNKKLCANIKKSIQITKKKLVLTNK